MLKPLLNRKVVYEKDEQDEEFDNEGTRKRKRFDKKKKGAVEGDPAEKPEFDMFEAQDAGKGEQFMAVRPYEGAIKEPASRIFDPKINSSQIRRTTRPRPTLRSRWSTCTDTAAKTPVRTSATTARATSRT